ncbi:hypothetical protein [Noviherbaspirillum sp. Root189]|uniref:hypothetical protein n=1 Tax=Noviherbaspirillum sp. Root189 TaxID=1736487 RepID=UPI0012E3A0E8|nr:hypothetical protein [Noviherbaspirillum sp. Root189]
MHPKDLQTQSTEVAETFTSRPVAVQGRILPKAIINAQAATKHPHNCMDLRKGGRRALHAILAFYNLKTRAAIFPTRETLAIEAGVSLPTLHRDLAELEAREYIVRLPQRHKSVATGPNAGKFWLAPILLTRKALLLLNLEEVIHKQPSLKMRDGIYIDKEHTKEVKTQSSSKNTFPDGKPEAKSPAPKNEFDPATKLPIDLLPLLDRGLSVPTIFRLMRLASAAGKRMSDIYAYRTGRIATLGLTGRSLYAYLAELIGEDIDFAYVANKARTDTAQAEEVNEAKNLLQRLRQTCDGLEVRKNGGYVGVFRVASNPDDCDYIETSASLVPVNLRAAKAILRGAFAFVQPNEAMSVYA